MIDNIDLLIAEPKYITYSYQEGISAFFNIIIPVLVFALISMIISLIIGVRKNDRISILVVNIMVKTVIIFFDKILNKMLDLLNLSNVNRALIGLLIFIAIVVGTIIIEGFIYKKVLQYKKYSGMTVSVLCNTGTALVLMIFTLIGLLIGRLLNNTLL